MSEKPHILSTLVESEADAEADARLRHAAAQRQYARRRRQKRAPRTEDLARAVREEITEAIDRTTGASLAPGFQIPTIPNLEGRAKGFFQRGHHLVKALMDIARAFYGSRITHPASLLKHIASSHAADDPFRQYVEHAVPLLRFIWNARNAIEHPKETERVVIANFSLLPAGALAPPTIEVVHARTPQPPVPIVDLFELLVENLPLIVEVLSAHLCNEHAQVDKFEVCVTELLPEQRREQHVRFSYAVKVGGNWMPLS